jgi:hypothetical protein
MSKRALLMIFDWSEMHYEELVANWHLARDRQPLRKISPLPQETPCFYTFMKFVIWATTA